METATAGLIGALIGATAGLGGSLITNWLQCRSEKSKWLREKRGETYSNAIKYLLHALNKRSAITATGTTVIGQDIIKEWFDEFSEAQRWLTKLRIYCSRQQKTKIIEASDKLNHAIFHLIHSKGKIAARKSEAKDIDSLNTDSLPEVLLDVYKTITECAENDLNV